MSNIVSTKGISQESLKRYVSDMKPGEVGYAVEWAVKNGNLDVNAEITDKGGTASMRVTCIERGKYAIEYESPVYRSVR